MATTYIPPKPPDLAIPLLQCHATPLPPIQQSSTLLTQTFCPFGSPPTKILLIGDASHGTSEYYTARIELTKYMITHHNFNIVAIEADWPDAESIDRYVRHRPGPGPRGPIEAESEARKQGREPAFLRFPTWMWRNREVQGFVEWLREWNRGRDAKKEAVGVYGLDLYAMGVSMEKVVEYLEEVDRDMAERARRAYAGLGMWAEDPHEYGLEVLSKGFEGYEKEVVGVLKGLLKKRLEFESVTWDGEEFLGAEGNARLVTDAENYYKTMYYGRDESWNLRDRHMFETLVRILKHRERHTNAKAVVWAHNSHIGDARATSMGWSRDELNVGQLCKETYGDQALAIGCLGNTGTVAAAQKWDADMSVMKVNPGIPNSYEQLMHATGMKSFALDLRERHCSKRLRKELMKKRLERFIGVIYAPKTERQSHYSQAVLPEQFDGLVWFDETRHVGALEVHQPHGPVEYDETWPFGL